MTSWRAPRTDRDTDGGDGTEGTTEVVLRRRTTGSVWWELLTRRAFAAGLSLLSLFILSALAAPFLYPSTLTAIPVDTNLVAHCLPPSGPTLSLLPFSLGPHPLGQTAYLGFGIAQGLIAGSRWDLFLFAAIAIPSAVVGVGVGLVAGTLGGKVDYVLMSATDLLLSIPYFIFVILVVILLSPRIAPGQGPELFIVASIAVMWAPFARLVRSEAARVRHALYVESARASGASTSRVMTRHILPNSLSPVLAQIPITVALIMTFIVASQYVTYYDNSNSGTMCRQYVTNTSAVAPVVPAFNYPEWGSTLSAGIVYVSALLPQPGHPFGAGWWGGIIPGLWITIFGLSLLLISDGVRDWLSPKARR